MSSAQISIVVLRVSRGTALAAVPEVGGSVTERRDGRVAPGRVRGRGAERGVVGDPRGPCHLERRRRAATRPAAGADRHRRLERSAAGVGARRSRCGGRRCRGAARRQLRHRRRRGGLRHGGRRHRAPPGPGPGHPRRARLDGDAHGGPCTRVGDDVVAVRQRLLRLRRDRGHGSAGQVADRRRVASALPDLRLRLGDRSRGRARGPGASRSTRWARTRSRRSAAQARTGSTCTRTAASPGRCASSSSASEPRLRWAHGADLRLLRRLRRGATRSTPTRRQRSAASSRPARSRS